MQKYDYISILNLTTNKYERFNSIAHMEGTTLMRSCIHHYEYAKHYFIVKLKPRHSFKPIIVDLNNPDEIKLVYTGSEYGPKQKWLGDEIGQTEPMSHRQYAYDFVRQPINMDDYIIACDPYKESSEPLMYKRSLGITMFLDKVKHFFIR